MPSASFNGFGEHETALGSPAVQPSAPTRTARKLRAAAVVAVHNELPHIDGLVRQLVLEGLDVIILDHGSTDGSLERALSWKGRGVLRVEQRPFQGVFSLREQLRWKQQIYEQLDHDWLVHTDADTWLHTETPGDRLVDLFARAEDSGATAVNFDEFVFVPDVVLSTGADPREWFCSYYFFAPQATHRTLAWRSHIGLDNVRWGGHRLDGEALRIHAEAGVLRHYPVLSQQHGGEKYGMRRFDEDEIADGWFVRRLGLTAADFALPTSSPALRRLSRWDSRAFDRSQPTASHYWERRGRPNPATESKSQS